MWRVTTVVLVVGFLLGPARADEQGQFLTKALAALQQQRNSAMDQLADSQAQSAMLRDELAAAQQRIAELEKKETPK